jgi:hypothetical protein
MADITVIFTHWKRTENLNSIMEQVKKQTVTPKIFVWNNSDYLQWPDIDWQILSSRNTITWTRWLMATMADTEFVCIMDDDLILKDRDIFERSIEFLSRQKSDFLIGPIGVNFDRDKEYANCPRVHASRGWDWRVDMILGRLLIFRRRLLDGVRVVADTDRSVLLGDDIIMSALTSRGARRHHTVPSLFHDSFTELAAPHGSCSSSDHYELREKVRRRYFKNAFHYNLGNVSRNFMGRAFQRVRRRLAY